MSYTKGRRARGLGGVCRPVVPLQTASHQPRDAPFAPSFVASPRPIAASREGEPGNLAQFSSCGISASVHQLLCVLYRSVCLTVLNAPPRPRTSIYYCSLRLDHLYYDYYYCCCYIPTDPQHTLAHGIHIFIFLSCAFFTVYYL